MKQLLLIILILFTGNSMASEETQAQDAIMTVLTIKAKEELQPYVKPAIKKVVNRLNNRYGGDGKPSKTTKAIGGFLKTVKEVISPEITLESGASITNIKLLEFSDLRINYKRKKSDLSIDFKANKKEVGLGLNMSF